MTSRRREQIVVAAGAASCAALSVGLAVVAVAHSRATMAPDVGPTSAALTDAFWFVVGAGGGLRLGAALTASLARAARSRAGLLSAGLAYLAFWVPVVFATGDGDLVESLQAAWLPAIPLGIFAAIGTAVGST